MSKTLTEEQVRNYKDCGFVTPLPVYSGEEAQAYRAQLENVESNMSVFFQGIGQIKFYLRFSWAYKMATHPTLLDAVEDLIGPNIMLYHNTAWIKQKKDKAYVSWHQDNTYFGHDPCEVLTAWVALSPATRESGCMQFVPGSHKEGLRALREPDTAGANMLSSGANIDISSEANDPVPIILQPGEASIHHAFLIHGSLPNNSEDRRVAVTFVYHPPYLQQIGNCPTSAMLVRGQDKYGIFEHETPPIAGDEDGNALRHEKAVKLYRNKAQELGNATIARFDSRVS